MSEVPLYGFQALAQARACIGMRRYQLAQSKLEPTEARNLDEEILSGSCARLLPPNASHIYRGRQKLSPS